MGVVIQWGNRFVVSLHRKLESAMSEPLLDSERGSVLGWRAEEKEEEKVKNVHFFPNTVPIIAIFFSKIAQYHSILEIKLVILGFNFYFCRQNNKSITMIQELKIKNFLSFKDEVTFSFEATKDTFAEDYQVVEVAPGVRLLRFAMVYGANASGKSNLLTAFDFLGNFWHNQPNSIEKRTSAVPFLLDKEKPNEPSSFELVFYVEGIKYLYQLALSEYEVLSEKLYYYKSVQPTMLFDRKLENGQSVINYGTPVKMSAVEKEKIAVECLKNMSFFAARDKVNINIPDVDMALNWMKIQYMPIILPKTSLFEYAEERSIEDQALKNHLLDFLKQADFNISDVITDVIKEQIPENYLRMALSSDRIPPVEKERLRREGTFTQLKTTFEHTIKAEDGVSKFYLPKDLESLGTLRTFGVETAIYYAQQAGAFLPIDEIENSLHPQLLRFILLGFLRKKTNAQLLVTTHYDPLLNDISRPNDQHIFRKDSVWFTEKNENGHTEAYSLAEFRGLNRLSSIQKAYNHGNFGAIPQINF